MMNIEKRKKFSISVAALVTETNSFAPFPTTYEDFSEEGPWIGNASQSGSFVGGLIKTWRDHITAAGDSFSEGLVAVAQSGGPATRSTYERLRDQLLDSIQADGEPDAVLLLLHGGMIADGYLDCEGDLLAKLRERIGPGPCVGVTLDPHCHLSAAMLRHADVLVCSKLYPHTDFPERMIETYELCTRVLREEIRPTQAVFDCRMIGVYPTTEAPMAAFVDRLHRAEDETGVLSASFVHGFELGDTPDTGSKILVYTDRDHSLAAEVARDLGVEVYGLRHQMLPDFPTLDQALETVLGSRGRVILADFGDNPGAGCAGDNMGIVRGLIEAGIPRAAAGCIWDPTAVRICAAAGIGAHLPLRLGGKSGPASGPPLDLDVEVVNVIADHRQPVFETGTSSFGRSVWLRADELDLVVGSQRSQVFSTEAFEGMGIDLSDRRVIVVKSGQHFCASFSPLADTILYPSAPHTIGLDLRTIPHRHLDHGYYPRVADPLELDNRRQRRALDEMEITT